MPRQMPTTLRPRILALKPAEEASSSRSKSAAAVPDVNTPSRTVRPPFRLFDPFSAGLGQFQPTAFKAPVRTSVATEFNSREQPYNTIKPRPPSIRKFPILGKTRLCRETAYRVSDPFESFSTLTLSLRTPQAKASSWDGNHMSMWAPLIDPPIS